MNPLHPAQIQTPESIIAKASKGDHTAFGRIYDDWAEAIYKYVCLKTQDEAVADDITAEVFLKVWKKLVSFKPKPEAKFSTWLFAIARNAVIDYYRTTRQTIPFENLPEIVDLEGGRDLFPEQTQLQEKLEELKPEYKQVLVLRYVEDIPISRVAQIMKKKEGNVRALTHRALEELKDKLS
ncbi:TPA: hypothetical protein DIV45_01930 [Patescibacteria group bacterium]|nr:hypothetical protein [Patescibacteria group bacterium]